VKVLYGRSRYGGYPEDLENVLNSGFEGIYVDGIAPSWSVTKDSGSTLVPSKEASDIKGGKSAQKLVFTVATGRLHIKVASNHFFRYKWTKVEVWIKTRVGVNNLKVSFLLIVLSQGK